MVYKEEVKGDTRAYFMTRESIAQRGRFDTGIAVNVLSGIRKKVKTSPSLYAHSFMTSQTDMRPTSEIVMSNDGSLRVARRYFEITPGIKHGVRFEHKNLYVEATANDQTDRVYFIMFETPASKWQEDAGIARMMIDNRVLDQSI